MKKTIVLALLFLGSGYASIAQRYEYGEPVPVKETKMHRAPRGNNVSIGDMRFGAFIAPTTSWMKPTANKSDDKLYLVDKGSSKMGFSWGLMMDYYFAENYGITTGFQLTYGGGKISTTENPAMTTTTTNVVKSADFDYKMQYLEVPFALKLRSDDLGGGFRVFGQIGVAVGVTLSKKATYDVVYTDTLNGASVQKTASSENEKIRGLGISPVLLQMNIGGGIEYAITPKLSFYTGLFFNNGFVPDVTNPKELDLDYKGKFSDGNTRLNNIALRIGLFF